jgi:hypothetical protein
LANPTQNMFVRFVRQPESGVKDYMEAYRKQFEDFGKETLKTRLSKYLED